MAYRLTGTNPFLLAAIGAFNGYSMHGGSPLTYAALLKRRSASAWHGIYVVDRGTTTNDAFPMEFNPSNQLAADLTAANPFQSTQTFNDTTNWMIIGLSTAGSGGTTSVAATWRWKIGSGAWSSEAETIPGTNLTGESAGYRHLIGNEAALGDDADFDIVCAGAIQSNLSQASFESLDMLSIATWDAVFTGAGAWLLDFADIATRLDRTGNGGDEVSRSAGITLVADPAGWSWGGVTAPPALAASPNRQLVYMRKNT